MTKHDDTVRRLFHGLEVPPAPPDVRVPALERAQAALARERAGDSWRHAWEDRRLRWAWAAAAAVLIVANVAVPDRRGNSAPAGSAGVNAASVAGDRELAAEVALPRIDVRHLQPDTRNTGPQLEPSPAGDSKKENHS
jgi:hypothetical protein